MLSFWVRSSIVGAYNVAIQNSGQSRTYVTSFSILVANTWEYKTIQIAGDTTGTWLVDNGIGLYLWFQLGMGSNYDTTGNTWVAGNFGSTSGAVDFAANSGATFYITGVQLEQNYQPTPFEERPIGTELSLCQRYFWSLTTKGQGQIMGAQVSAYGNACYLNISSLNPVPMRVAPTPQSDPLYPIASYSPFVTDFNTNLRAISAINLSSPYMIQFVYNSTQLTANQSLGLNFADTNRTLWLSAEL
jgi:hypothetical protein